MAASRLLEPVDLRSAGYVEEEFFISGRANVYDWAADGGLTVRTPAAPYTTRILVRRPADAGRFSGSVIVELGNNARIYDWAFTWSLSYEHFMRNGDVWVGLTYVPAAIDGLKAFNATRYAPLSMANPAPGQPCAAGGRGAATPSASEEGLRWDILSQLGALLRGAGPGSPLAGFKVQRVYATSHGGELPTYIAAVHPQARLAGGQPVYDGFLVHRHANLARIHQCAAAPGANDPRQVLRNAGVPVIRIVAQTDVLGTFARRRDDSDDPRDRYRLYEVAGAPHADAAFYVHMPVQADQTAAGTQAFPASWPFANRCDPDVGLMAAPLMRYTVNAALTHLDRWVRQQEAPPRAARIAVRDGGTPQAALVLDEFGNVTGGVRNPFVDVPTATYSAARTGGGQCGNLGFSTPFDAARLKALYGAAESYASRRAASIDRLVRERWLTDADAAQLRRQPAAWPEAGR
jgi:hypothetical protein